MGAAVGRSGKECDLQLDGKIRKHPQYVEFGVFLQRHEIEYGDLQRSDILRDRTAFIHYKYVFIFQYLLDRKIILYLYRHWCPPLPAMRDNAGSGVPGPKNRLNNDIMPFCMLSNNILRRKRRLLTCMILLY